MLLRSVLGWERCAAREQPPKAAPRWTVRKLSWFPQDLGSLRPRFFISKKQRSWCLWNGSPSYQGRHTTCCVCLWCYRGYSPTRFPCCFPKKASLEWLLAPSRAKQARWDIVSGAGLGEGKSWIKWWWCKMLRAETCLWGVKERQWFCHSFQTKGISL